MAYQVRHRDPLFDRSTQAVIERRGKELLGVALLALAVLAAMILASYAQDDPSWLSATDAPAENLLGRFGASLAQPTFIIVGAGGWALPLCLALWGLRFLIHRGEDRVLGRAVFAPIFVALASVYAATHVPPAAWTHSFGLGGLLGDTVLGAVLNLLPLQTGFALKLMSLTLAMATLALGLYTTGFTPPELRSVGRFLLVGSIVTYAAALRLLGVCGAAALAVGRTAAARASDWRARRRAEAQVPAETAVPAPVLRNRVRTARPSSQPSPLPELPEDDRRWDDEPPPPRLSLLARVPGLLRRPQPPRIDADDDLPLDGADRIRAKIAGVIHARARANPVLTLGRADPARAEPPLLRPRGPQPMILPKSPPLSPAALAVQPEDDDTLLAESLLDPDDAYVPSYGTPVPDPKKVVQHALRKPAVPSRQAQAEAQPRLKLEDALAATYEVPPLSLLASPATVQRHVLADEALEENARMLEAVLDDYGVKGEIVSVRPGPVVTMYELEPAPGLKASRVIGLSDDIARSMSALSARVSTVPGRSVIGIELPNAQREKVVLREILSARDFGDTNMRLPLALGKDIGGGSVVANLAKMPHLLIAGTTGSGKSVAINTMILSLLYRLTPDECRMIMIDPKMLELSVYDGIPHLLSPVVTDPKKAVVALKWVVGEMEDRYRRMSKMGVRNIEGYNGRVREALDKGETFKRTVQTGFDDATGDPVFETDEFTPETIPYIVVIVDEMADLMMVAGKEIEACIQRLAQMARASGIHLIMATQRPSVDVITGTIKANFPTRISFQVTSKIDSRTILGEQGAEQLLGMGDMLYMAGGARITRVHGPFVSDEEVEEIVNHLKSYGPPEYVGSVLEGPDEDKGETSVDELLGLGSGAEGDEALYEMAVQIVAKDRKCSTSYIQRKLAIGYNKAARLVEQMEDNHVVTPANHVGKREVLVPEVH